MVGRHEFLELTLLGARGKFVSGDHHGGRLARDEIGPGRLAGRRRRTEDTEQIIAELEGLADGFAIAAEHIEHGVVTSGQGGTDLQRPADRVVARFAACDVEHIGQAGKPGAVVDQVGELADRQFRAHRVIARPGARQCGTVHPALAQHLLGPHQAQVTEQHRGGLTEAGR